MVNIKIVIWLPLPCPTDLRQARRMRVAAEAVEAAAVRDYLAVAGSNIDDIYMYDRVSLAGPHNAAFEMI